MLLTPVLDIHGFTREAPVLNPNSQTQFPTGITIQSSRFWNSVEGRTWSCIPCMSGCVPSGRHFWTHNSAILKCKLRDLDSEGVDVGICSLDVENWWRRRHVLLRLSYLLIRRTCYISTAKSQEARGKAKHTYPHTKVFELQFKYPLEKTTKKSRYRGSCWPIH